MRMAAILAVAAALGAMSTAPSPAADPVTSPGMVVPPEAIKAADSAPTVDAQQSRHPAARRLDPSGCAELCRLFERLWSIEKRVPAAAAPTS